MSPDPDKMRQHLIRFLEGIGMHPAPTATTAQLAAQVIEALEALRSAPETRIH